MYDYGARNYDPAIGRWMNIDPLAELAYELTPNRYCYNNPIRFVDPSGLWEETATGYKTDKADDIKRFMSYLGFEKNALNNSPTNDQMSSFVEGEMSDGGHGKTSDGAILADELTIVGSRKDGNFKGYADKSFQDFSHGVQRSLTPDALDPRTIGQQFFGLGGLTYPGPSNPRTYAGNDDYSYVPKGIEEFPALAHDLAYDKLKIRGGAGLFTATKAIKADYKFVTQELAIALTPAYNPQTRGRAGAMAIGLGALALPKTVYSTVMDTYVKAHEATKN